MDDHIVGMMWNKNEGDILVDIIESALQHVDTLVISDDGSTDNSWDIIQGFAAHHKDQIEHIQRAPNKKDKGQRQDLLNVIKERYKPEDTWVQIIESDIMILDTDIKRAIRERGGNDSFINWRLLNATIPNEQKWPDVDAYPNWSRPIQEIMTYAHILEDMKYTFRPFEEITYEEDARWRPWSGGLSQPYPDCTTQYTPLLAHYGYRGPKHFHKKFFIDQGLGIHAKYRHWLLISPASVYATVSFFNGGWNNSTIFPLTRKGYMERVRGVW